MTFELGINYWPRRSAMYMWRQLDMTEVREDMARIAELGFDVVRIFTMAPDFMPQPLTVAPEMVARLVEVTRAAKDAGLRVVPTFIVVNMSGHIWWPPWMLDANGRPRDLFSDKALLQTQALLVETCVRALSGDDSIRAFDLANEIDDAQLPRTRDESRQWVSLLAGTARGIAPDIPVRIGAHLPSLTTDNNMRIDDLGAVVDEDVMHAYPLYSSVARSFLDPELVPFSCGLTAALSRRGRSPIMQEFGLCTAPKGAAGHTIMDDFLGRPRSQYLASEEEAATYFEAVLERLVATGAAGAYGWCYADYDPRLFDRAPFDHAIRERTFGLVRSDGTEKPAAGVFRDFRAKRDGGLLGYVEPTGNTLDITPDDYYRAPELNFQRLYTRWIERVEA